EEQNQLRRQIGGQYRLRSGRKSDTQRFGQPVQPQPQPPPETPAQPQVPMLPHISMDPTVFPMATGTQPAAKIKTPPRKYYNLTYTWGWRIHPPRAQAMENAQKALPMPDGSIKPIVDFEREVFVDQFKDPIDALGDLAPAKRMWRAFKAALDVVKKQD